LILPVAPPAAGKTTLRHWLVGSGFDPDGVVCPDDYRRIMTGDQANQKANTAVFDVVNEIVDQRLQHGLNVYVDATNLSTFGRDGLYNMAFGTQAKLVMVLFDTPYEECTRRNNRRPNPVPQAAMDRMFDTADAITKTSLRREASGSQVYTPDQFMSYSWEFLIG